MGLFKEGVRIFFVFRQTHGFLVAGVQWRRQSLVFSGALFKSLDVALLRTAPPTVEGSIPLARHCGKTAPEPVFSGSARPGTQIVGRVYDSTGILIGEEMAFADVGGNWMMQFHELTSQDHARVEFQEIAGIGNSFAPHGDIYGYLGADARDNVFSLRID